MKIYPDKNVFLTLTRENSRVPLIGEKKIQGFQPENFFEHFYSNHEKSFLLESGKGPWEISRYTFMGASNHRVIKLQNGKGHYCDNGTQYSNLGNLKDLLKLMDFNSFSNNINYIAHFWGGWVGYLGYEAGQYLDPSPFVKNKNSSYPDLYFMEVDRLWIYDHKANILKFIIAVETTSQANSEYDDLAKEIQLEWKKAEKLLLNSAIKSSSSSSQDNGFIGPLKSNLTKDQYMKMVDKVKDYISEGDIYQANVSQKFKAKWEGNAFNLYKKLRKINPSPFSGFLKFNGLAIVSSSPERLVRLEEDYIETRPIAGTRPRGKNPEQDNALSKELLLNEKERAEHLMLIDLERNDLGRICEFGSVKVSDLMLIERYSHVSHIVSNVEGKLKKGISIFEILKAVFPGGTITGCPKIRCREIIGELEPASRGAYSGALGYIGFAPFMDLNIIIRSLICNRGEISFHVGAGIVADSIPQKEYRETLDKAEALLEVLELKGKFS